MASYCSDHRYGSKNDVTVPEVLATVMNFIIIYLSLVCLEEIVLVLVLAYLIESDF